MNYVSYFLNFYRLPYFARYKYFPDLRPSASCDSFSHYLLEIKATLINNVNIHYSTESVGNFILSDLCINKILLHVSLDQAVLKGTILHPHPLVREYANLSRVGWYTSWLITPTTCVPVYLQFRRSVSNGIIPLLLELQDHSSPKYRCHCTPRHKETHSNGIPKSNPQWPVVETSAVSTGVEFNIPVYLSTRVYLCSVVKLLRV